ncbi:MAG: glycosyltransferase [Verrucomicrobia bacterium]|nr:glycosyltransferase [Verrucomicrobiota bacterium]
MDHKIACIIPSYNHAAYIQEAIESVLNQTLPPSRLIIIDDGSVDNSAEIIRSIKDPRIELYEQANRGAHAALTRGLQLCQESNYVSVLNSDDRYHRERFAKCTFFLQQHKSVQLVCSRIRLINESGSPVGNLDGRQRHLNKIWSSLGKNDDLVLSLAYGNFTKTTSNFFFRSGAIDQFYSYRYAHDYFAALLVGFRKGLGVIHQDLLDYRVHATNTIKADGRGPVVRENVRLHLDLLALLRPDLDRDPELRKRVLSYLKLSFNNYTDMRAELLVLSLARMLSGDADPLDRIETEPEVLEARTKMR